MRIQLFLDLANSNPGIELYPALKLKSDPPLDDEANLSQIENTKFQDWWKSRLLSYFFVDSIEI